MTAIDVEHASLVIEVLVYTALVLAAVACVRGGLHDVTVLEYSAPTGGQIAAGETVDALCASRTARIGAAARPSL